MQRKEGDFIMYDKGPIKGEGYIVGIALVEQPLTWIVRRSSDNIDPQVYPYTCITVAEYMIVDN